MQGERHVPLPFNGQRDQCERSSFISPFAYLGSIQIERVAARLGRDVEWKPVLIGVTIVVSFPIVHQMELSNGHDNVDTLRGGDSPITEVHSPPP